MGAGWIEAPRTAGHAARVLPSAVASHRFRGGARLDKAVFTTICSDIYVRKTIRYTQVAFLYICGVDPILNPYAPGAGLPPAALVGRDQQRQAWQVAVERTERGRTSQSVVLYGLRGMGKTVLLSDFARSARDRHWIVAQVEAGAGKSLRAAVGEAVHGPLADLVRPSAGRRLLQAFKTALSFKASYDVGGVWNFGLDLTEGPGGGADTGVLETDLSKLVQDLSAAAGEEGVGLAIMIDEAQDLAKAELEAVCAIAHVASQNSWSCMFALAGLPSLPRVSAEAKSYAEGLFAFERVEHLDDIRAAEALNVPAALESVHWEPTAVDFLVKETAGLSLFPPTVRPGHLEQRPRARPDARRRPARSGQRSRRSRQRLLSRPRGPCDAFGAKVSSCDCRWR